MSTVFPSVPLSRVVKLRKEFIQINEEATYKRCRAQVHAKGIVLRDNVSGSQIKTKKQQVCQSGELLVAEIDAKVGGYGIVPPELDGAIVSSHYFLFTVDETIMIHQFLDLALRRPSFLEQVRAQGSTNYAAIRADDVLRYRVPLPTIEEQRRIVRRIESLAERIEEARDILNRRQSEIEALLISVSETAYRKGADWTESRIGEFCDPPQYGFTAAATEDPVGPKLLRITDIQDGGVDWNSVPFCLCRDPSKYLLNEGDIVFARTGATTGKSFLIRDCPEAVFASYLIRLRVRRFVTPDYLYYYFQTSSYWSQITDEKWGTGQPNLNGRKLANMIVPIAPSNEQTKIVADVESNRAKIQALRKLQMGTLSEIEALTPSVLEKAFNGDL